MSDSFDLLVVGGGINGSAIARAAAVAGRSVLLVERGDLAGATSSASTKLIHGGLRYLEYYEFKLVREALRERAIMLRTAPHLVRPLEFRLPHRPSMRPWPIVRLGLWLYDLFSIGGGLPRSRGLRIDDDRFRTAHGRGFSYWDAWVDDARLVVLNARDAEAAGAEIRTRTALVSARREGELWQARLATPRGERQVTARMLVNAAGPWVDELLHGPLGFGGRSHVRLVRGSHIVVRRAFDGDHGWLLQQPDGRIVFAIPYLDDFTLIGTTDVAVAAPEESRISSEETDYLLDAVNLYLRAPLTLADIVGDYAGIRPLFDDGADKPSAITRDYRLELDADGPKLLSVFGGKITTARHLASVALDKLGIRGGDTRKRPLPGGDVADFADFLAGVRRRWPFLDPATATRMARAYGTGIAALLDDAASIDDLGRDFGAGLSAREVDYLVRHEWATCADDILWRRTKLGYRLSAEQAASLEAWLQERQA
jgi:glycerol-3-phosphate dehydrogenase